MKNVPPEHITTSSMRRLRLTVNLAQLVNIVSQELSNTQISVTKVIFVSQAPTLPTLMKTLQQAQPVLAS
jgi:hypothetical protein